MNNAASVLSSVLSIIGYQSDKAAFIEEFLDLCVRSAFVAYMNLLPEERKNELKQVLLEKDPVRFKEQVDPYVTTEEYKNALAESTQKLFQKYTDTLMPLLSDEQKDNLDAYFASLSTQQQTISSYPL